MFAWITHFGLALISLLAAGPVLADSFIQSAGAQCPASAKIYIDPRLVPQRPKMSRERYAAILADPNISEDDKKWARDVYLNQYQPIQMPFRNGYVLISGTDYCIQQYIP